MNIDILNKEGEVINRLIADKEFADAVYPGRWRETEEPPFIETIPLVGLDDVINQIKNQARFAIQETDWRVERANERMALGLPLSETLEDVYFLREEIRQKSNQMELAVANLSEEELASFKINF